MTQYLTVADFTASRWGAGLEESEAGVYVEYANAVIDRMIDPLAYADTAGAAERARIVGLRIANAVRKNFDGNSSVSIGGKLSVSFASEEQIEQMARSGLGNLAMPEGAADVSFGEIEPRP